MKKREFKVPENTKMSIAQVGDRVIIDFIPDIYIPKDADSRPDESGNVFIYNKTDGNRLKIYATTFRDEIRVGGLGRWGHIYDNKHHLSTSEEKQRLIDALKSDGYQWNAEAKKIEKIRWRANKNETYYSVNITPFYDECLDFDNDCYNAGNYFKTKEDAEKAKVKIIAALLNDE